MFLLMCATRYSTEHIIDVSVNVLTFREHRYTIAVQ